MARSHGNVFELFLVYKVVYEGFFLQLSFHRLR